MLLRNIVKGSKNFAFLQKSRARLATLVDLLYPGTFTLYFMPPETQRPKLALLWDSLFPGVDGGASGVATAMHGEEYASETDDFLRWIKPLTQHLRGDIHAVKTDNGPSCRRSPLPEPLLRAHFAGGAQVGLYTMAKGADTTRVALLDLDSHQGATGWPEMVTTARRLSARAEQRGLKAHAFRSSGGRGVHLIFVWREPQHAYSVRLLLRKLLTAEGLSDGAGGVVASQVEIFPKQDLCFDCGHMFILPLGGKSCPLDLSGDGEVLLPRRAVLESWWKWRASAAVPVLDRPAPRSVNVDDLTIDLQTLKAYCDLIPNEGDHELPYEQGEQGRSYLQLMMAVHRGSSGSDEGLSIAGEMFSRSGKYQSENLEYKWASITPREGGITVRTLINAAKFYAPEAAHAIEMKTVEEGFEAREATPEELAKKPEAVNKPFLRDVDSMRVGGFLDAPPAPRRFIFKGLLPLGTVTLLGAAGGTGKSQFAIQMGMCAATGDAVAGQWEVEERGASLLLCSEDETEELHRRVHNTFDQMTATDDEDTKRTKRATVAGNLFVTSLVGSDVRLITQESRGGWSVNRARVQEIITTANRIPDLKLIVLDPASRFRAGDENDADGGTRFIEVLEQIKAATGATVLATAHVNKNATRGADDSSSAFRGASALTDGARMALLLRAMNEREAKAKKVKPADAWKYLRVDTGKFNYGPPVRETWLKKGVGGFLHRVANVEPEQEAAEAMSESALRSAIVRLLRDRAVREEFYSVKAFNTTFGGLNKLLGVSERQLRALVDIMVDVGQLKIIPHPIPQRGAKGVLAPGEKPVEQEDFDDLAAE